MASRTPTLSHQTAAKICHQEIVKYDLHVKAMIQDIRECCGPKEVLSMLTRKVAEQMKNLRDSIEKFEKLIQGHPKEKEKSELTLEANNHKQQYLSNQVCLRNAILSCQMLIDRKNRDILFSGGEVRQRNKTGKESMVRTTSGITSNLQSISRMMAQQVEHSQEALHSLASSSTTLTETQEEFKSMGSVIQQSHQLLSKYGRREVTDKVLMFVALAFFFACVLYIIKKRLF